MEYELIWSEKFVDGMANLNNRAFINIIKKVIDVIDTKTWSLSS